MIPRAMARPCRRIWRPCCFVALSLLALAAGCGGKGSGVGAGSGSGASMPLADAQYLTYTVSLDAPDASHQIVHLDDSYKYEIKALDNAQWRVEGSRGQYSTGPGSSYTVDNSATVAAQDQSEFAKWKVGKRFNDLWLAPDERQSGKVTHPLDDFGDFAVGQEAVWHRWVVVPAVSTGADTRETRYYEAATGWLVGKELERTTDGSKRVDVLSDTNVAIPTH
jgi:hypothetical protein